MFFIHLYVYCCSEKSWNLKIIISDFLLLIFKTTKRILVYMNFINNGLLFYIIFGYILFDLEFKIILNGLRIAEIKLFD